MALHDYKQMPTGQVNLRLRWKARTKRRSRMDVIVMQGKDMRTADAGSMSSKGGLRPYVLVRLHTSTQRTVTEVGAAPRYLPQKHFHANGQVKREPDAAARGELPVPVLYAAAVRGDDEEVKGEIDAACEGGVRPSTREGPSMALRELVNHQPEGRHGNTALHRAAANGHSKVVRELLRAGAGLGRTALSSRPAFSTSSQLSVAVLHARGRC